MNKSKLFILKNPILEMNKSKLFISKPSVKYTIQWQIQRSVRESLINHWHNGHNTWETPWLVHRHSGWWQTRLSVSDPSTHDRQAGQSQTYWSMTDTLVCHRHTDPWQTHWSVTDIMIHDSLVWSGQSQTYWSITDILISHSITASF